MAPKSKKRERRKLKIVSAANRMAKHKGGGFERTATDLPEGVESFRPDKEGTYRLELIPYKVGKGNPYAKPGDYYYERTYYCHRGIGADQNTYICPSRTFSKKCPICEYRIKLDKSGEADEDTLQALAPKQRQLFAVFNHKEPDKGVQVWDVSYHNFGKHLDKKIRGADEEDREKYEQFYDPEDGYTLRVGATEESMGKNTFLVFTDIEFRKREKELDPALIDEAPCLDELLIEKGYDELKKILLQSTDDGDDDSDDDDDEDDEKPKKKRKPKKEDDDGDEDEEDSEDEESGDDDEDEDSDDSDDDESSEEEDEDDEEGEAEDGDFSVRDKVTYIYRGKRETGKIVKINRKKSIAEVDIGKEKPRVVELDELEKAGKKKAKVEDDDEEDENDEGDEGDDSDDDDSDDSEDDGGDEEDDQEDEDEPLEDDDDEDEDEPLEDDDEDEDEPKPKKRKKK